MAYDINLKVDGISTATISMQRMAITMVQVAQANRILGQSLVGTTAAMQAAGRQMQTMARQLNSAAQALSNVQVPAMPGVGGGGAGGGRRSPASGFDLFARRLTNLIYSTRVNFGGGAFGASPLIGRSLSLFGAFGTKLAPAIVAIGLLTASAIAAASSMRQVGLAMLTSGGTAGNISSLQAMGMGAGSIAGAARSIREHIQNDPMAMAEAGRAGIPIGPSRLLGGTNEARVLLQVIEYLRKMPTDEAKLMAARRLGAEELLQYAMVSEKTRTAQLNDAKIRAALVDPRYKQASIDLQAGIARIGFNFESLGIALMRLPVINAVNGINKIADAIGNMAKGAEDFQAKHPQRAKQTGQLVGAGIGLVIGALLPLPLPIKMAVMGLLGAGGALAGGAAMTPQKGGNTPLNKNTEALQQLARILEAGLYGMGGPRTQGALGGNWKGYYFSKAVESGALRYGAFTL